MKNKIDSFLFRNVKIKLLKYGAEFFIIAGVFALLFGICLLDIKNYVELPDDRETLLCMLTGFPLSRQLFDARMTMLTWMSGIAVLYFLTGNQIYDQLERLKYIALIRYGSYQRFYRSLVNKTVINTLFCGGTGALVIYMLYAYMGNSQVRGTEFLKISAIWLSHLVLLCLAQTFCMIWRNGHIASIVLLVLWYGMAIAGHRIVTSGWIWIPANWGMYIRSADMISGGVPDAAYYAQTAICVLLWAGAPALLRRRKP